MNACFPSKSNTIVKLKILLLIEFVAYVNYLLYVLKTVEYILFKKVALYRLYFALHIYFLLSWPA